MFSNVSDGEDLEFLSYEQGIGLYMPFERSEGATPFHSISWLKFISETLPGARLRFLVWDQDGYPVGVMPVVERVRLGIKAAYSVPFDAPGGPLGAAMPPGWESYFAAYWHARVVDSRGELECSWPFETRVSQIIDLNRPNISRSQLKAGRQALRRGVEIVQISSFDPELYKLYQTVKRQRGGLTYSKQTLESMFKHMQDKVLAFVAVYEQKPIAFILNLVHNQSAVAYLHGFDRVHARLRPMSALILRSIDALRQGPYSHYSLGTSDPRDKGQLQFKASFGARPKEMRIFIKGRGLARLTSRIRSMLWRRRGI